MDKSWMNKSRISREYFNGVQEFVTFASKQATDDGMILCPQFLQQNAQHLMSTMSSISV